MATKYNIDINNARPNGNKLTTGVYIGNGTSNRESFFGVRGTGGGSVTIYDKVLYTLEMTNATGLEPSAGRYYASSYASTNKRKHGNGVEETGMALKITSSSQAYIDIPANTSTSSTQTTAAQTVTQYDDSSEHLAYDGAQVTNWTLTQKKNYPTGITLTLSTPTDIPANGGSVNSVTYTAKAQMKAGNEVDVTSDTACTITWTGVTGNNLTTTIKNRTNLGNLTGKVTYVCNGATVTATASVAVYQAENKVTAVAATCGTFAYTQFTAAGGSAVPSTNNANTFVVTYSSTSTSTTAPASTYGTWAASVVYSMTAGNGFTLGSTTTGSVTAAGRGTTTGATRSSNTITKKYDISWTPNASYPGTTRTSSNSKTTTASQEANAITSYDAPTGLSLSATADIPASGGTRTAGVAGTCSQVRHYTSTSTDTINPTATYTAPSETASSLGTTAKARTKISTKSMTYTANGKSSTTNNVDFYQEANAITATTWNNPVVSLAYATPIGAGGGYTLPTTKSATQSGTLHYTSSSTAATSNTAFTWSFSHTSTGRFSLTDSSTGQMYASSKGTSVEGITYSNDITATATGSGSKTGSNTANVSQGENKLESTTWNNPVVTAVVFATKDSSAGAATRSTNASATQSGTLKYTSTATAATSNTSFTWAISSNNANAVITNGTTTTPTLTWATNTGTTERSATITTKATGAGSKSASATSTAKQEGTSSGYLRVTPNSHGVASSGATGRQINVSATTAWVAYNVPSWVTLDRTTGSAGSVTFSANVASNSSTSDRSATITFSGGGMSDTITFNQSGVTVPTFTWYLKNNTSNLILGTSTVIYNDGTADSGGGGQSPGMQAPYTRAKLGISTAVTSVSLILNGMTYPSSIKFDGQTVNKTSETGGSATYSGSVNVSISAGTTISITD